jgi:hypothetical protein
MGAHRQRRIANTHKFSSFACLDADFLIIPNDRDLCGYAKQFIFFEGAADLHGV